MLGQATHQAFIAAGVSVVWVRRLKEATVNLSSGNFDAVVLDLSLPDGDGIEWLSLQRKAMVSVPVLILSARDSLHQKVKGLEDGADDYLTKPFAMEELLSRLKALIRRVAGIQKQAISHRGLMIDLAAVTVYQDGLPLNLSRTEFLLLEILMKNTGRVVTRHEMESRVLMGKESNSLDMHMSNLRRKVKNDLIRTVRGVGYILDKNTLY